LPEIKSEARRKRKEEMQQKILIMPGCAGAAWPMPFDFSLRIALDGSSGSKSHRSRRSRTQRGAEQEINLCEFGLSAR